MSVLFTDVRDSTALAEKISPREFRARLDRFFKVVVRSVDANHGVIDHIVGDGVMALWTPGFGGPEHANHAIAAGRLLVADMQSDPLLREGLPAGVGVHTGTAWVGVVGETGTHDFTVLGDVPNTVARLGSAGAGGELFMSEDVVAAAELDTSGMERRLLELKGKAEAFAVWVDRPNNDPDR